MRALSFLAVLLLGACGPRAEPDGPPELPGRWAVDVTATLEAARKVAGEAVLEPWMKVLDPQNDWLRFEQDGRFVLHLGKSVMPISIEGTWKAVKQGAALTPLSVNGEPVAPEARKTDTVRRDGTHLVIKQGQYGLYLQHVPEEAGG